MTTNEGFPSSDIVSRSITPEKGSSIVVQRVKVSKDGLYLLIKPFTKSITFHPSESLWEKDIILAYGQTIKAYQEWYLVATKHDHPMLHEPKNLENLDVDVSRYTMREGDILGDVLSILD